MVKNKLPFIEHGNEGGMDFHSEYKNNSSYLLYFFLLGIAIFFFILISRLFQLTIVKGSYYRGLSENNRIREIVIEPKRGIIEDRKGFILAQNEEPIAASDGSRFTSRRVYTDGSIFSQVLGYRQLADTFDFNNDPCLTKLHLGDKVGKKGVEKLYDCNLRGKVGQKLNEVDARGKYVKTLTVNPPADGDTVHLAIDSELQKKTYEVISTDSAGLKDRKVVVVGLKPRTGEVLIMASTPSFDSQIFEDTDRSKISQYFTDSNKPLFNRATEGTYPPGSTFKIVIAAAALEEKKVDQNTEIEDKGFIKAGSLQFGNWYYLQYGKTDGMVNVIKALQRSNDIYFYLAGNEVGPEKLRTWAERFGFEAKTGIGIDESAGIIPSPFWKEDVLKEKWYTGDTYNMSIGQGYALVTPLQVAQATAVYANGGYLCQPQLLKVDFGSSAIASAKEGQVYGQPNCKKVAISDKTLALVREGMRKACETGGTAWPLFDFSVKSTNPLDPSASPSAQLNIKTKISLGCKTGTAESHGANTQPHAWFTVFAPYDNPEIVITVLVEEGGQGSDIASPIARDILTSYFERQQ